MGHRYQSANKYCVFGRSSATALGSRADLQYAGLGGASLTCTNLKPLWISSKKSPARITQRGSRADLEAYASRPKIFSHKHKLLDVTAITFWRSAAVAPALGDIHHNPRRADHARRRWKKRTRMAIVATAHAMTHARSAMSKLEVKKKDPQAKAQQRNVRSFQPAPPGSVLARASAIGERTTAKDPKTRRASLSTGSISEALRRKIKS